MEDLTMFLGAGNLRNGLAHGFIGLSKQQQCSRSRPIDVDISVSSDYNSCDRYDAAAIAYQETYPCPDATWKKQSPAIYPLSSVFLNSQHQHVHVQSAQVWNQDVASYSNKILSECKLSSSSSIDDSYCSQSSSDQAVYRNYEAELRDIDEVLTHLQELEQLISDHDAVVDMKSTKTDSDLVDSSVTPATLDVECRRISSSVHQQYIWQSVEELTYAVSPWMDTSTLTLPVNQPTLTIVRQPPQFHRARYEKEAKEVSKGLLKTTTREPVVVQLDNMLEGTGDITLTISTITIKGTKHPYIYPSCFGRGMPSDWKKDEKNRTVRTILREKEGYRKSLSFLGIKRNKLQNIDLRSHTKNELNHFRVEFEAAVPSSSDEFSTVTATTQSVRILCPSTATRLRKMSEGEGRRW